MKNNRLIPCVMLLFAASLVSSVALAEDYDLSQLYSLASGRDPFIGRAKARLNASVADKDIAVSQFLPHIDANAGINWISNNTLYYAPGNISGSFTGDSYAVGLKQPLFQLPNNFDLAASRAGINAAKAALSATGQDLIIRLTAAYFKLLKAQTDETLSRDEVKRLEEILKQAQAALANGTGDIISVYEAEARKDSAVADLVKAGSQRRLAEQELSAIAGRQVGTVKEPRTIEPQLPEPNELGWWIDAMLKSQPALTQAREQLRQAEERRKAVQATYLPTMSASTGYTVSKGSTFLPQVETRLWYVGFNLDIPIYSGGETSAKVRRSLAEVAEQRSILDNTLDEQTRKVRENFLNLQDNIAIIKSLRQKKVSTEQQLVGTNRGREIGTRTAIDLLNAEQGVEMSKRDLIRALYDNVQLRFELKAAAGLLSEDDLLALSSQMVDN